LRGLAADRQCPWAAALAQHPDDPLIQIDVVQGHACALGAAHAGVDQQQDDGGVAAAGEVATLAGLEQPSEVFGSDYLDGLLGELGRLPAGHRAGLQVALGRRPLEEGVQAPVAVVSSRQLPPSELVGDERLDVLTSELADEERHAAGLAVSGE
jgi:hypothetical protein